MTTESKKNLYTQESVPVKDSNSRTPGSDIALVKDSHSLTPSSGTALTKDSHSFVCPHVNIVHEQGAAVCEDCGEEIYVKISQEKNQRYNEYDKMPEPVRGKSDDRNIFKDVENLGFNDNIITKANQLYLQVTNGKIFRGRTRKAIIFACIFHAYKMAGKPQTHEKLFRIFDLKRKTGLKGLKFVNQTAPKDSKIRTTYISPKNIIEEIMEQFGSSQEQKQEVVDIYEDVKKKTTRLNRSRPQSVASAIVYYWIIRKKKNITLKEFAKQVGLSELTIGKIAKEVAEVYETGTMLEN